MKNKRTRQIGINVTEEIFQDLKVVAAIDGVSFSYKVFTILQQYMIDHKSDINDYIQFINHLKTPRQAIKINENSEEVE